jgi:NAD(P)-dependent dehydrogenase (short-subunit alcohol dehydrogenase family)
MLKADFEQSEFATRKEFDSYYLGHYPQGAHARFTQPEEVAECIYFLASKDKVEAITGACLSIDFGITSGY